MTSSTDDSNSDSNSDSNPGLNNSDWKSRLSPEQYYVMREGGTEPAFSGAYYYNKEAGDYRCGCCHTSLFDSEQKYESGSGWPSFWAPTDETAVAELTDRSHGMTRVEVRCKNCDAHLGHVFEDGPKPTGLRYCINSLSLDFVPRKDDN